MTAVRQVDPWRLESLKRRLDALPQWLGESRGVRLTGLPPMVDIEGQFRLFGLRCLLASLGAHSRPNADHTTIWLGHGQPPPAEPRLLLWPGLGLTPDDAQPASAGLTVPLPDPIHALWGLLEQLPPGHGLLYLPRQPDWRPLLPLLPLLARLPAWLPTPPKLLRTVLARAQRLVRAHETIVTPRPAGTVLAAVLGRGFLPAPAVDAYWRAW